MLKLFSKVIVFSGLVATIGACNSIDSRSADNAVSSVDINSLADTLSDRWKLTNQGIEWQVSDSHEDHIEMSGEQISTIIYYGSDENGNLTLNRKLVWPMLRTIPNDTHASLIHDFPLSITPVIKINNEKSSKEQLKHVRIDGVLALTSQLKNDISLTRTLSPSTTQAVMIEQLHFVNKGNQSATITTEPLNYQVQTPADKGIYGVYTIEARSDKSEDITIKPGESASVFVNYFATKQGQNTVFNSSLEIEKRRNYVASLQQVLQLKTPDPVINKMFDFAKLRSAESIFRTKGGLMHAPGGGRYYAAIWANDQAEYINPFFPFLGNQRGNESAINSFRHFARFMNDEGKHIPSSIIAEGDDIWDGAGDRGDCAMIAYGASRYALAIADKDQATELLPLIDWCLDYSYKKINKDGVIGSDSDELEGRFPAGDYNLSTNMLTYGALISANYLNNELDRKSIADEYYNKALALRTAIESYFGANVQGFDTYQYYEGNDKLRAWIALPLTFGIFERKEETLDALLSEHLWSADGIYSEAGNKTFWDRATLYAFRGIFSAQETDTAMRYFKYYSRKRLLGEHVPYAVEAWPEGNQRHLSAESALYARTVTEGLFGIEPTGFKRFNLAPYLPSSWNNMCLKHIRAFNNDFNLCVERDGEDYTIKITQINGHSQRINWDGKSPVSVSF
ncbi:hypothetical protein [Thalassotalea profundi]|uniref:Six-hairpin glycosidase-like protein n=1 Tax=Thalassotalea profundi TaxID=2036687 RepID=A0ABQ3IZ19_9GAMM|nr:hypothetical protein [Thalassotalea profundi]GHE95938.1 hypothetical protein GCM10011501_26920 [Thalassotalea profundi]